VIAAVLFQVVKTAERIAEEVETIEIRKEKCEANEGGEELRESAAERV
jgi:hypothetical protein